MARSLAALVLRYALASAAMAARHRPVCVAVMIEMVPARICPPAPRR
ncbi:hypothetical protein ACFZ8E_05770 [Methylobacterium sp. HMF5984]